LAWYDSFVGFCEINQPRPKIEALSLSWYDDGDEADNVMMLLVVMMIVVVMMMVVVIMMVLMPVMVMLRMTM